MKNVKGASAKYVNGSFVFGFHIIVVFAAALCVLFVFNCSYWINGTIFFASAPLLSSWIGFRGSIYHLVIESICFVKRRTSSKTPPRLNDLLPFLDLCDKTN